MLSYGKFGRFVKGTFSIRFCLISIKKMKTFEQSPDVIRLRDKARLRVFCYLKVLPNLGNNQEVTPIVVLETLRVGL
jgi:hypothetical protein